MHCVSSYVSRGMGVRKVSMSKSDLEGHSRALAMWCHSIGHISFNVSSIIGLR